MTGATGYIGGRLVPELLAAGFRVRLVTRQPRHLAEREWHDQVEVVRGDASDPASLAESLSGAQVAYDLIHSLRTGAGFEALPTQAKHARKRPADRAATPPCLIASLSR